MEKRESIPLVRFGFREEKIYFNHAILTLLGNPKFVQFLYDGNRKLLFVAGNNEKLPSSLPVPAEVYKHNLKDFRICHKHFAEAFICRLNLDRNKNYSVNGEFNPHIGMVVFELERATITEGAQG